MKLNEISDLDKDFLTLKNIEYDFIDRYNIIVEAFSVIGKSLYRRNRLKNTIIETHNRIEIFLNEGFDNTDPDVINARDIYSKIENIRNQI